MTGKRRKQLLWFALQVMVAAGVFIWIFQKPGITTGLQQAWDGCDPLWLGLAIGCAGASIAAHIWRWWFCLRLLDLPIDWRTLSMVFLASSFIGTFMAGGVGGDAARVMMLAPMHRGKFSRLAISVIADRLCGLVSLFIPALLFTLPAREILSGSIIGKGASHFLGGYLVLSTGLFIFCFASGSLRAQARLPRWLPARDWFVSVSEAFRALRPAPLGMLVAILSSALMLFLHFATFWCIARGCQAGLSLQDMCTVLPVLEAATAVPATPSGVGIREKLFIDQLSLLRGTEPGTALLISLAGFACGILWYIVGGIAALFILPKNLSSHGILTPTAVDHAS